MEENKLKIKDEFFEKFLEFYENLEIFDKNHLNEILVELIKGGDYLKFAKEKGKIFKNFFFLKENFCKQESSRSLDS